MKRHGGLKPISKTRLKALGGHLPWSSLPPSGRITSVNPERQAKRRKKFKARLSRADWKALRRAVFARDGWRCTNTVMVPNVCYPPGVATVSERCPFEDETRTGKGLVCDHLTYARFGHELLEDLQTLCTSCDRVATTTKRANWMRG